MDKDTNKNLEAIKKKIDKKSNDIDNSIYKSKQEIIGQINKPLRKDYKVILPLVITIILAICISYFISYHFSTKTDKTLQEIKEITTRTESGVLKLLNGSSGTAVTSDVASIEGYTSSPPIKERIVKASITPEGTITLWVTLNRPGTLYQKGYIFDIGDSLIKNRMSLLVDENGFLNWKIYESNYNIHVLKYDINKYIKGERFFIALTWSKEGDLIMYINAEPVSKINLDKLSLNIQSEDMYWGSDIEGNYIINFG